MYYYQGNHLLVPLLEYCPAPKPIAHFLSWRNRLKQGYKANILPPPLIWRLEIKDSKGFNTPFLNAGIKFLFILLHFWTLKNRE